MVGLLVRVADTGGYGIAALLPPEAGLPLGIVSGIVALLVARGKRDIDSIANKGPRSAARDGKGV
jgi:hypothetical protein